MSSPLLLSLLALLVAGCVSFKEADARPELSGRYGEPLDPDLANVYELVGREEFEFFPDGTAISRWIMGKTTRDLLLKDLPAHLPTPPVVTERRDGKKVYVIKTTGTWRFEGKRLVFQGPKTSAVFEDVHPWPAPFTGLKSLLTPNRPKPTRYDFRIDTNGDLLRIPPRGHPYYAGRFVKQQ